MGASVIIREGSVRLRVVPNPKTIAGRRFTDWEFRWRDGAGRARRLKRALRKDAIAEARRIARELAQGRSAELSSSDVASFRAGLTNLLGCGVTIEAATAEYAEARRRLAGAGSVLEAADFFARAHAGGRPAKPIAEVVDELIAAREREGAGERHLGDLKSRGGRIKRDLGTIPIGELSAGVLSDWLWGIKCGQRTRLNFWRVLSNLTGFAIGQKYLPRGWPEMDYVKKPAVDERSIEIFTPEELGQLLRHARPSVLPALLLGAFGGLRTSETLKLDWSHVRWQREVMQVPAKTKTGPRNARLFPNLAAWLQTIAPVPAQGSVVRVGLSGVVDGMLAAARRAGLRWKRNGLRHSFVSYRAALDEEDLATVAKQAGHSVATAEKNYRRADIFAEDAQAWFAIYPAQLGFFGALSYVSDRKFCPLLAPSRNGHAKIP